MVKLLIVSVTYDTPQNRLSDIITHMTLYTINNVVRNDHQLHTNSEHIYDLSRKRKKEPLYRQKYIYIYIGIRKHVSNLGVALQE